MNKKIDSLAKTLSEKKIKPSLQRMKILEYLIDNGNHPTVERIFNDLLEEIPTLSKATVYNTLDLFKKENLARVVTIEDNETRYDAVPAGRQKYQLNQNMQVNIIFAGSYILIKK